MRNLLLFPTPPSPSTVRKSVAKLLLALCQIQLKAKFILDGHLLRGSISAIYSGTERGLISQTSGLESSLTFTITRPVMYGRPVSKPRSPPNLHHSTSE